MMLVKVCKMKRSGKFYRKNESEVMQQLGFKPTPNSGSGWVIKEDGQNENAICQLKSTDKDSIKINLNDVHILQYNAQVSHKIPVFAVQFIKTNEVFLLVKSTDVEEVVEYIKTGERKQEVEDLISVVEDVRGKPKIIKSSAGIREEYRKEIEQKYEKRRKKAN